MHKVHPVSACTSCSVQPFQFTSQNNRAKHKRQHSKGVRHCGCDYPLPFHGPTQEKFPYEVGNPPYCSCPPQTKAPSEASSLKQSAPGSKTPQSSSPPPTSKASFPPPEQAPIKQPPPLPREASVYVNQGLASKWIYTAFFRRLRCPVTSLGTPPWRASHNQRMGADPSGAARPLQLEDVLHFTTQAQFKLAWSKAPSNCDKTVFFLSKSFFLHNAETFAQKEKL